ncbi:MAG: hypothetical protein CM15mP49_25470 [Actinomycetota bacterium]|nr:MAG: hypothetical protein CM15mP49_25470 [Actinomycetota bacterium]
MDGTAKERTAHLLALEAAGLPNTGVPNIPTGCEIIIGGQLCGITPLEDADVALQALEAGLGDPMIYQTFLMRIAGSAQMPQVNRSFKSCGVPYMLNLGTVIHHSDNASNDGV